MTQPERQVKDLTDPQLLAAMAGSSSNGDLAEAAWEEFYRRHFVYLQRVCRNAYGRQLALAQLDEFVQDAFIRVYEKAGAFKRGADGFEDAGRRHARAWLGTVLKNLIRDRYSQEPQMTLVEDVDQIPQEEGSRGESSYSPIEAAFDSLDSREQEVLRETMLWHKPGEANQRMPNEAASRLAAQLGTTPANIRKIRSRAIQKLRQIAGDVR